MLFDRNALFVREKVAFAKLTDTYELFDPATQMTVGEVRDEPFAPGSSRRVAVTASVRNVARRRAAEPGAARAEVLQRHGIGLDEARPDAVQRRRKVNRRTAREAGSTRSRRAISAITCARASGSRSAMFEKTTRFSPVRGRALLPCLRFR